MDKKAILTLADIFMSGTLRTQNRPDVANRWFTEEALLAFVKELSKHESGIKSHPIDIEIKKFTKESTRTLDPYPDRCRVWCGDMECGSVCKEEQRRG